MSKREKRERRKRKEKKKKEKKKRKEAKENKEKKKEKEKGERMKEKKENDNTCVCNETLKNEVTKYRRLVAYFNDNTTFKKIDKLNDIQLRLLNKALERFGEERIKECFLKAEQSDFLSGRKSTAWVADFDWIIETKHICDILNGKYKDYKKQKNIAKSNNEKPSNKMSSFDADEFLEAALTRSFE